MGNNRTNDPSKQKLAIALLNLMEKHSYKNISIKQISEEAQLSRITFYRIFSNKEQVLNYIFTSLFDLFFDSIKNYRTLTYWEVMQLYFDFWESHRSVLQILKDNDLLSNLIETNYAYSMKIFEEVRKSSDSCSPHATLPYMIAYSVGGMNCMMWKWVEQDMQVPSKDLIAQLEKCYIV